MQYHPTGRLLSTVPGSCPKKKQLGLHHTCSPLGPGGLIKIMPWARSPADPTSLTTAPSHLHLKVLVLAIPLYFHGISRRDALQVVDTVHFHTIFPRR